MAFSPPPLPNGVPIVDGQGMPTVDFQRWWQDAITGAYDAGIAAAGAQQTADIANGAATSAQQAADAANANADTRQPADATLTALAALDATSGLVEQTGANAFAKRPIGIGTAASIPTRSDSDGRYVLQDVGPTWTLATGTKSRATFDTGTVTLPDLAQRVGAIIDDLKGNGALA